MGGRNSVEGFKNPRRVTAGKVAYARRKAAQDAADEAFLSKIEYAALIGLSVIGVMFVMYLLITARS